MTFARHGLQAPSSGCKENEEEDDEGIQNRWIDQGGEELKSTLAKASTLNRTSWLGSFMVVARSHSVLHGT